MTAKSVGISLSNKNGDKYEYSSIHSNNLTMNARAIAEFRAVRDGQLSLQPEELVRILDVKHGYAFCERTTNGERGDVPSYFLEMADCPGANLAEQIRYRRRWYAIVDELRGSTAANAFASSNPDVFISELGWAPRLAPFAQVLPDRTSAFRKAPFVVAELTNCTVRVGDTITLECCIHSPDDVPLRAVWYTTDVEDLNELTSNNISLQESHEDDRYRFLLTVTRIRVLQSGQYSLMAENEYGRCVTAANVLVLEAPTAPRDLRVLVHRDSVALAQLRWTAPCYSGGSPNLWYGVECQRENNAQFCTAVTGIEGCTAAIHLTLSNVPVEYAFRVYAYNVALRSLPSAEKRLRI